MKKHIYIFGLLMAVFGFSACNGDYDDWAAPQSNAQEDAITIPGYTAAAAGAIDLNQAGESINMFTLSSAALPEGSTVENNRVKLTPTGEGVKDELSKTIELTADCKADSAALQALVENAFGKRPVERIFKAHVYSNVNYKGDDVYVDAGEVNISITPAAPNIEPVYYYFGDLDKKQKYAFKNSGVDPYDDPVFHCIIPASTSSWHWFKIGPASAYDEEGNMVKEATCLCPVKNDETDTKGRFTIGKNSWHLTQADGAPMYDIAFNVLTNEYKFTPVQGEAIFDTNPQLYFTSSNNVGEWLPLVPVHSDATMSWIITYLHEGEEFKFAPQASADNAFGATAQVNDLANMNPSTSNGYIKTGNAGWYLLQVINDGADKTVNILTPNVYLFGNTSPAGWSDKPEGLFTIPTSEDGVFVSPAFIASDNVRMCVKLDGVDWWKTEFVIKTDGQLDYRAGGNDQAGVKVKQNQKCFINFTYSYGYYQ